MTTNMRYASYIPEEFVINWVQTIDEWELQYKPTLFARNYLPYRTVPADADYDAITYYDADNSVAQFISKGSIPEGFTARARTKKYDMYCIATGFTINERDLAKAEGAAMKTKELQIAVQKIHMAEDKACMLGDGMDLIGIVGAARANTNGKVAASGGTYNNNGAWAGTDDSRDPYEDINLAMTLTDFTVKPTSLVGNRQSLSYLNTKDSERHPFWKDVAGLFNKPDTDRSWMVESQYAPDGYVYLIPNDPAVAEFTVSQEIDIDESFAKQRGGNYWIETKEWVSPAEIHQNNGFVEIAIG